MVSAVASPTRRIVLASCVIIAITYVVGASLSFLLTPMLDDVGLTADQGALALAIPAIGSLLIVFVAGRIGDSRGHRVVIVTASIPFVIGGLLVTIAINGPMLIVGLLLAGAAATAMQIAVLGLLQSSVPEGRERISAFTTFGMVFPAVYVIVPVATGWSVGVTSWRIVPVAWWILGLAIPVIALAFIPRPIVKSKTGEFATPLLAGLVLASSVQLIDRGQDQGWNSPIVLAAGLIALASALVLWWLTRMLSSPSFTFGIFRDRALVLLLVVVGLIAMVNTLNYVMLALQYIYGLSVLAAAVVLLPAQVASVIGAKLLAGALMARLGALMAGRISLIGLSASLLLLAITASTMSVVALAVCASLMSMFGFASITITNASVMGRATTGQSGLVSATRGAASAWGSALGIVIVGAVISTAIRAVTASPSNLIEDVQALIVGLQAFGIFGAILAICGAFCFGFAMSKAESAVSRIPAQKGPG